MDNRIIQGLIGVIALIVVGLGVLIWIVLSDDDDDEPIRYASDDDFEPSEENGFSGPAIDSGARIEIEGLRSQIEAMREQMGEMQKSINQLSDRLNSLPPPGAFPQPGAQPQDQGVIPRDGPNQIIDAYAQVVLIANRRNVNKGLQIASPSYLESVFGKPRQNLTSNCESMTNERLRKRLKTTRVGPVRVTMQEPALESLARVFEKIKQTDPDLHDRINTAGALCVRHIRGAPGRTSTHAFGLSLDLNIDGQLDRLGDGKTQLGLTILADFFKTEGWYWGAGFSREDSMHFEVSRDLVEKWIAEGKL